MPDGKVPLIHSVSYGNDEVQQTGVPYMLSVNVEFQKLGVRGISVLFASGDQGVCGRSGCGWGIFKPKSAKPDFPGGSPYITVVGGTNFLGDGIGDEEVQHGALPGAADNIFPGRISRFRGRGPLSGIGCSGSFP